MEQIQVLVIDDHPVVRQGLRSLLNEYSDIRVVGEADGSTGTINTIARLEPDILLLDIRLEEEDGLGLARRIRVQFPQIRIIILTSYDEASHLVEAARIGVQGYLLKSSSAEVLADAIRAVHNGKERLSPSLGDKAFGQLGMIARSRAQTESGLSDQEVLLLQMIANGSSVQEIALKTFWSERTVKRKIRVVLNKLQVGSRTEAVAEAFKRGIL